MAAVACANTDNGGSSGNKTKSTGKWDIPDTGAKIPSGDVKLHWVDSGDSKADFFHAFFPVYEKKHSNVHVTYDGISWNAIAQQVGLGLRNGTAPDVFQLPPNITPGTAIANKWLHAVDDIVPNWPEVKKRFPPGVFANGVSDFGGKTYGVSFSGPSRLGSMILYSDKIATDAGVDLGSKPVSWAQFRQDLKTITKKGNGKYYGLILGYTQAGGTSGIINAFTEMSGVHGTAGGINWQTGEYNFTHPLSVECVELMLAIKSDNSIFPGAANLDQPGARERFPQGVAGVIIQGPWNITTWKQTNPDFTLGVNLPALKDPNKVWPASHGPGGSDTWWVSSKTKQPEVIGDIFSYLATTNGQERWTDYNGAGDPPAFLRVIEKAKLDALNTKAIGWGTKYTVLAPAPAVRNPDVEKVFEVQIQPTPTFDDTLVGLMTGQIKDPVEKVMKKVEGQYEKSLDDAIKLANKRGAKVSRDDWVFKDWDPTKSYTKLYEK
ncbi:MAG: ABC transporter substrate-binding protein [Mycobacteriales bacterium]